MNYKSLLSVVILGLSVFLGTLFSFLFTNQTPGISVPIFVFSLSVGVQALKYIYWGGYRFNLYDLGFPLLFLLSLSFAWHDSSMLLLFDSLVLILGFVPLTYFSLGIKPASRFSFLNSFLTYVHNVAGGLVGTPSFLKGLVVVKNSSGSFASRFGTVIRNIVVGYAIAVPLLIFFTALFALADEAFRELISKIDLNLSGWHFITAGVVAAYFLYVFIGLFVAKIEQLVVEQNYDGYTNKGLPPLVTSIVLFSLNLLFTFFIGVQFVYLFGDHDKVVELELTYSEYARKGFWELQFITIVTMGLIYLFKRFTAKRNDELSQGTVKFFIGWFIIDALIILFSAHTRMNIYENGYGYTELRFYPHVFMLFEAVLFGYLFVSNIYRPLFKHFSLWLFLSGFVICLMVNAIKPDYVIGLRNIQRYEEGKQLDVEYLLTLSPDAYLQLNAVDFDTKEIYRCELLKKKEELNKQQDSWKEFNATRYLAEKEIEDLDAKYTEDYCDNLVVHEVRTFLKDYSRLIEAGNYDEAKAFWRSDSQSKDLTQNIDKSVDITEYDVEADISEFIGESKSDYYSNFPDYMTISTELRYKNSSLTTGCKYDYLTLELHNGKLKIANSSALPLINNSDDEYEQDYRKGRLKELGQSTSYETCSYNYR